jgi:hypothetical protein
VLSRPQLQHAWPGRKEFAKWLSLAHRYACKGLEEIRK